MLSSVDQLSRGVYSSLIQLVGLARQGELVCLVAGNPFRRYECGRGNDCALYCA